MEDKLLELKISLQKEILRDDTAVEDSYITREEVQNGDYNFSHAGDAFESGWECGEIVGYEDALLKVIDMINKLEKE